MARSEAPVAATRYAESLAEQVGIALEDVPPQVIKVALAAARLIGNGLYGVDVKERDGQVYVIEVNDNPNLESGVEDAILGAELYRRILAELVRRIELRRAN